MRAFPSTDQYDGNGRHVSDGEPGMTLRQFFVAAALHGIMANPAEKQRFHEDYSESVKRRAELAIHVADKALELTRH